MGWQSDWLYRLVFDEVARVWQRAQRDGTSRLGPAPTSLVISETREADRDNVLYRGEAQRRWTFRGGEPELLSTETDEPDAGESRGMFYERGRITFCVATDRKQVLFTYTLGPRYGRGLVLAVTGQGQTGKLIPNGPSWVS